MNKKDAEELLNKVNKHGTLIKAFSEGDIIQHYDEESGWVNASSPSFWSEGQYRIKPDKITINGREINAPYREVKTGSAYFYVSLNGDIIRSLFYNLAPVFNANIIQRGVAWKTKEDAIAYRDAIDSLTRPPEED